MLDWIRNKFQSTKPKRRKSRPHSPQQRLEEAFSVNEAGDHKIAKFDRDKLKPGEIEQMSGALTEHTGLSMFEGTVEHGYTLEFVGNVDECPRCGSETECKYGEFVYATQSSPRIMLVPAGYFCLDCSTVIIDQSIIKAGIVGKYRFKGVIGMSHDGEDFYGFETWNGQKPVFVFDEHGNALGLESPGEIDFRDMARARSPRGKDKQQRNAQKAKKKQRKQNRKRK